MGLTFIRAALNSARNVHPADNSPQAQAARRISGFADLDGLEFAARIDIEEGRLGVVTATPSRRPSSRITVTTPWSWVWCPKVGLAIRVVTPVHRQLSQPRTTRPRLLQRVLPNPPSPAASPPGRSEGGVTMMSTPYSHDQPLRRGAFR